MIKRSFISLSHPRLKYDSVEPAPKDAESIPVPPNLILSIDEPLDGGKTPLIKTGDPVKQGQKLSLYKDSDAYAVSPVFGTIKTIDTYADDFGHVATYLIIEKMDPEGTADPVSLDLKEDIDSADQFLRTLPGAPPLKLLNKEASAIRTIVIYGADTDLLSTTQQYITLKNMADVKAGAGILKQIANISQICIVIPESMRIKDDFGPFRVIRTRLQYPSNQPAMILKDHMGMILPAGSTPEDFGICFVSAEAVASIARAYREKTGLFEKVFTVIGKTGEKKRVKAFIGTPLSRVFSRLGIRVGDLDRIVIGGPMTGFSTYTISHPVQPDMDTVIVQDQGKIPELSDNACVNCGKCIRICPANIPVNILIRYLEVNQYEEAADKLDLLSCIDCGLCAYVCTARIPLYQHIRLGKHELSKLRADVEMEAANE